MSDYLFGIITGICAAVCGALLLDGILSVKSVRDWFARLKGRG